MAACPNCGAQNEERARFCLECGAALSAASGVGDASRRTVTILFSDVVGSTAMGEALDAETVRSVMGRYFSAMEAVITRHGGRVEKFVGDAIMAVFGLPVLHEDDALRAVRAADEMRRELARLNESLLTEVGFGIEARTGLNTGEVVAGVGAVSTLVTGDAVNTAARLEQAAAAGQILVGDATARLVRQAAQLERVTSVAAKGKAEPVPAFQLLSIDSSVGRTVSETPLVARDSELAMLLGAFAEVEASRACGLVTIVGQPGVGKSRLVAEFVTKLEVEGRALILRGRCLSYGEGLTYWPLREITLSAAGVSGSESREEAATALARITGRTPDAMVVADRLATALGLRDGSVSSDEIAWAARRTVEALAAERPLVLVVEDIHWARSAMLELVSGLVADAAGRILIVCPARPELLESYPGWSASEARRWMVVLEGLPPEAGEELIEATAGGAEIPGWLRERILQTAEGNPLFVEEMVHLIIESGQAAVAVPPTIEALMAARIDQLPRPELAVAQRGAVVGRVFEQPSVEALLPLEARADLDSRLRSLLQKDVIRDEPRVAGADSYKFRHILIRDAAYNAMAKLERARLHEAFADWLELSAAGREAEYAEILGHHLEQAYRYLSELRDSDQRLSALAARAAAYLVAAGRTALDRGDASAAAHLLERSAALPGLARGELAELHLLLAEALATSGEPNLAVDKAEQALSGAEAVGDRGLAARARVARADALEYSGRIVNPSDEYVVQIELALSDAEASGDPLAIARALEARMLTDYLSGRLGAATEQLRRAADVARRADRPAYQLQLEVGLLVHELVDATPARAVVEHGLVLLDRTRTLPGSHSDALRVTGVAEALLGRFEVGRAMMAEGLAMAEDLRRVNDAVQILLDSSWVERLAGDLPAAETMIEDAVRRADAIGDRTTRNFALTRLLVVLVAQDKFDDAQGRLAEIGDVAQTVNRVRILCAKARIDAAAGGTVAGSFIDEAFDLLAGSGFVHVWTDALIDAGEAMAAMGDIQAARRHFARAIEICDKKENVPFAGQLRVRLASLPAG